MKTRMGLYGYQRVTDKKDMIQEPHYAALVFNSYNYDSGWDDGPSRANKVDYLAFENKAKMEEWVVKQETSTGSREPYQIIEVFPKQTKLAATVVIE